MSTATCHSFTAECKAVSAVEREDGDLILEGWAAEFEGIDRHGENFAPGAFERGIKAFLDGPATLAYHHKHDHVLGKVLDLREVPGRGLWMRARVDGAIRTHPVLGTIYSQIRRGTLRALSVGGFFRRVLTPAGYRIGDMDFTEISVTGVPAHVKPAFSVVAAKALECERAALEREWYAEAARRLDLAGLMLDVAEIRMRTAA
jgi:HK97 family phage prohead protease